MFIYKLCINLNRTCESDPRIGPEKKNAMVKQLFCQKDQLPISALHVTFLLPLQRSCQLIGLVVHSLLVRVTPIPELLAREGPRQLVGPLPLLHLVGELAGGAWRQLKALTRFDVLDHRGNSDSGTLLGRWRLGARLLNGEGVWGRLVGGFVAIDAAVKGLRLWVVVVVGVGFCVLVVREKGSAFWLVWLVGLFGICWLVVLVAFCLFNL